MKLRSIEYYIKEAFRSIFRNSLMSVASVLTVTSCILMLIVSYCIAVNIDYILNQFENSVGLSAMIDDNISADDVNILYKKISSMEHVKSVAYVTAEDAFEQFKNSLGEENSDLLDGLKEDNPLPRSFDIVLEDNQYLDSIIDKLELLKSDGIYKVRHAKEQIDLLMSLNKGIGLIGGIIITTLALISVIIIMNTIKLTVNSRRTEINIMKYVGATDWFIRWPFVIEGVLIGLFGALIPITVSWFLYGRVVEVVYENLPLIQISISFKKSYEVFANLVPITVLGGMLIGSLGSVMSMRKYLKV